MSQSTPAVNAKDALRRAHLSTRRELAADTARKQSLDDAIVSHTLACLRETNAVGTNIAAYNPLATEPGPADFATRLTGPARTVFLPISLSSGELAWSPAAADDAGAAGALGVVEPTGARFTSQVLRSCGLIVAPALAVDRGGMRLGKGKGYYDRALAGLNVPVAAVVYDEDIVDAVPCDDHDQPVDYIITPSGFFRV